MTEVVLDQSSVVAIVGQFVAARVPKHVDMKQKLDQLAENNTAIVTLIKAYASHAKTSAFASESDKFRNYASCGAIAGTR